MCAPVPLKLVASVATPALRVPVPSVAAPSLKVTVPLGLAPVTFAVRVTDWLTADGFGLELSVVVLLALLTLWLSAAEVLVA